MITALLKMVATTNSVPVNRITIPLVVHLYLSQAVLLFSRVCLPPHLRLFHPVNQFLLPWQLWFLLLLLHLQAR